MRRTSQPIGPVLSVLVAAGCTTFLAAGCTTSQRWQLGLPGTSSDLTVTRVERRGELLDVWLQREELALRSFVPASPVCSELLQPERTVTWSQGGSGTFHPSSGDAEPRSSGDAELRCRAAGIGSLEEWRDRLRATPGLEDSIVPSAQADYRIVYRDEDVAFLRGRFPLAGQLGWTSLGDTIAVVPTGPEACADVLEREVGTMEYFARGTPVLALMGSDARCPIVGLVRPGSAPGAEASVE